MAKGNGPSMTASVPHCCFNLCFLQSIRTSITTSSRRRCSHSSSSSSSLSCRRSRCRLLLSLPPAKSYKATWTTTFTPPCALVWTCQRYRNIILLCFLICYCSRWNSGNLHMSLLKQPFKSRKSLGRLPIKQPLTKIKRELSYRQHLLDDGLAPILLRIENSNLRIKMPVRIA